jgi:hypothetical protein
MEFQVRPEMEETLVLILAVVVVVWHILAAADLVRRYQVMVVQVL